MKLWNRFKYMLLKWLLGDICNKSECTTCKIDERNTPMRRWCPCMENYIFKQAREVWDLGPSQWDELTVDDLEEWKTPSEEE